MSRFAQNVLTLGSGNVAAQLISILAVPVITRIYAPEQFGAFSFVFSLVAVLFPISTLRLNSAILLPKDEETAGNLFILSIASVVISSLVAMPVLAYAIHEVGSIDDSSKAVLWFLVVGVLIHGLVHCFDFWLLRQKRYGLMAWGAVGESVADRSFAIAMGIAQHAVATWLVLGRVVGSAVHLLIFIARTGNLRESLLLRFQGVKACKDTLRRYRQFPLYATWAHLFANGGRELPTLVLAGMFSAAVAGMYALGVRVLGFPMLLVGDAISKVFFRYATELSDQPDQLFESTCLLVRSTIYMMFPPMLLLSVAGPWLFSVVFGEGWVEAGRFAQILSMSFLVSFLYRVLSIFFNIYDKQGMRLVFDGAQFFGRVGIMTVGALNWGAEGAMWGLLLATLLVHGGATIYLLSLVGLRAVKALGIIAEALINLLPLSAVLIAAGGLVDADVGSWSLMFLGVLTQLLWLAWREPRLVAYAKGWGR